MLKMLSVQLLVQRLMVQEVKTKHLPYLLLAEYFERAVGRYVVYSALTHCTPSS